MPITARQLLALFLVIQCSLPVAAQSLDSLPPFKNVRTFVDRHQRQLLVLTTATTVGVQGLLHASFYSRGAYADIHLAAEMLGAVHYATAYVAGLDPVQAYGATMIGDVFFQGMINQAIGRPFIDSDEARHYEVAGRDVSWRKVWVGNRRYTELGLGLALATYPYWYPRLRRALR